MLNKQLPYKNIIMRLDADFASFLEPNLPEGFKFKFFEEQNLADWAKIETAVLEFENEIEAQDYFKQKYMPKLKELKKRLFFICNEQNQPIATTMAWFVNTKQHGKQLSLGWVSVLPEYQGRGLGKALVLKAFEVYSQLDAQDSIWLDTQTWSNVAVKLYHNLGFNFCKSTSFARDSGELYQNDFKESIEVLRDVFDEDCIKKFIDTSVE